MTVLPEIVHCPRLTLRRWRRDDVSRLRLAVESSTEHLRPWMPWIAQEPLPDGERRDLIRAWESEWSNVGDAVYVALLAGVVVGGCGLHRRAGPETLEIGYWVHYDHLRCGYATEMARALTTAALSVPGVTRVEIHHDKANVASRGVPATLGFQLDGERPDEPVAPAEVGVDVSWSMTAEAWLRTA